MIRDKWLYAYFKTYYKTLMNLKVPLEYVGSVAALVPDRFEPGTFVLSIDGAEQSHVDPQDPLSIRYEYLQRIDAAIRAYHVDKEPRRVLHLGAGALTLVRALQVRYPESGHTVVDIEPELVPQICQTLPLPAPERCTAFSMDAAQAVAQLRESGLPGVADSYDAIVVDIFHGADTAPQLQEPSFYDDLAAVLRPAGMLVVNIGDEQDQRFARRLVATIADVFPTVTLAAHPDVLAARSSGNTIVAAFPAAPGEEFVRAWAAAGPFPAQVLGPGDINAYVRGRSAK